MRLALQKISPYHVAALVVLARLLNPGLAMATQGSEDKCMVTSIVFFAVPALITLAAFTIYALIKLKKQRPLAQSAGKKIFFISIITLAISVPLPTWCLYLADWFRLMVWAMFIFFTPVLILSIVNIFLAKKLRAKAKGAPVSLEKKS